MSRTIFSISSTDKIILTGLLASVLICLRCGRWLVESALLLLLFNLRGFRKQATTYYLRIETYLLFSFYLILRNDKIHTINKEKPKITCVGKDIFTGILFNSPTTSNDHNFALWFLPKSKNRMHSFIVVINWLRYMFLQLYL